MSARRDGEVIIGARLDSKDFTHGIKNLSNEAKRSTGNLNKYIRIAQAAVAGYVTRAIYTAGRDFETAFAGVRKTVDATDAEFAQMEADIRKMARNMPASAVEIAGVAEAAGQLGIAKENVTSFAETMIKLGDATNLTSDQAADSLARFANIMGMSADNYDRLGSTIVDLGNNLATTESEIVEMGMRIAGAGKQVGMSEADVMAFAGALSSVGIEAEAGGTAFSQLVSRMNILTSKGGPQLEKFAQVAGMSADEFKAKFQEDASGAILAFIQGLDDIKKNGGKPVAVLKELGLSGIRMQDMLLRASSASDIFSDSLKRGKSAWEDNSALAEEYGKRCETVESKVKMLKNKVTDMGISVYKASRKHIVSGIDSLAKLAETAGKVIKPLAVTTLKLVDVLLKLAPALLGAAAGFKAYNTALAARKALKALIASSNAYVTAVTHMSRWAVVGAAKEKLLADAQAASAIQRTLLTGVTKGMTASTVAATVATNALKAAMGLLGGPIGIAMMALGACAAIMLTTKSKTAELSPEVKKLGDEAKKARKGVDDLVSSHKSWVQQADENIASSQAEALAAESMADELYDLAGKTHKTATEKQKLSAMVDQLNKTMPGLNLLYDKETDKLNLSRAAISKKIDAMKREAEIAAYMDVYKKNIEERLKLEEKGQALIESTNALLEKKAELEERRAALPKSRASQKEFQALTKELASVDEQLNKNANSIDKVKGALNDNAKSADKYSSAMDKSMKGAGNSAKDASKKVISALDQASESAKNAGKKTGSNMSSGIKSKKSLIAHTASNILESAMRSAKKTAGSSGFKAVGRDATSGVIAGLKSKAESLASQARSLMATALEAMKKRMEIQSPSRVMDREVGRMMTLGIVRGMRRENKTLLNTVSRISNLALRRAYKYRSRYAKIGELYMRGLGYGIDKYKKRITDKFKSLLKINKKHISSLLPAEQRAVKSMLSSFQTAANKSMSRLRDTAKKRINDLSKTYQRAYDNLIAARASYQQKLASYGSLLTTETEEVNAKEQIQRFSGLLDHDGHYIQNVLDRNIKALRDYRSNLKKLKGEAPEALIQEILGMDVDSANKYMAKISSMSQIERARYINSYKKELEIQASLRREFEKKEQEAKVKTSINNLKADVETLRRYRIRLLQLKKIAPTDLLEEVKSMDVGEANTFMVLLKRMSEKERAEYFKTYREKKALEKKTANDVYANQFTSLKRRYRAKLKTATKAVNREMKKVGANMIDAMRLGIESRSRNLSKSAVTVMRRTIRAVKKALGIKSPSRVFYGIGDNTLQGAINAIKDKTGELADRGKEAASALIDSFVLPDDLAGSLYARLENATLGLLSSPSFAAGTAYPYSARQEPEEQKDDRPIEVHTTIELDGAVVARKTARYMDRALGDIKGRKGAN